MNFYGSAKYKALIESLEAQVFSKLDLSSPTGKEQLDDDYYVMRYYYADVENQKPGCAPVDGELCRLFKNGEFVYEWKNIDGHSRFMTIISHSNGNKYLVFDEDLYGYSVLDLTTKKSVHYIPYQSYQEDEDFVETFIWCQVHYDSDSNLLAVEGCYWACPYTLIILDFSEPMGIVESNNWLDVPDIEELQEYTDPDFCFLNWQNGMLNCNLLSVETSTLIEKIRQKGS